MNINTNIHLCAFFASMNRVQMVAVLLFSWLVFLNNAKSEVPVLYTSLDDGRLHAVVHITDRAIIRCEKTGSAAIALNPARYLGDALRIEIDGYADATLLDALSNVIEINELTIRDLASEPQDFDAFLGALAPASTLHTLSLCFTEVSHRKSSSLGNLKALESLTIGYLIGEQDLEQLSKLPKLRRLDLCGVTSDGMNKSEIDGFAKLESLSIVNASDLQHFGHAHNLHALEIAMPVSVADLHALSHFRQIESLRLHGTPESLISKIESLGLPMLREITVVLR